MWPPAKSVTDRADKEKHCFSLPDIATVQQDRIDEHNIGQRLPWRARSARRPEGGRWPVADGHRLYPWPAFRLTLAMASVKQSATQGWR